MGRGHTIPDQPHPSHPARKGEIIRRSAEPKHLKEADKPKAPKSILTAATVAASAGALIMTATPALAEESASETAPAKDTAQTETAATTTESAKQTLEEATAARDKAAADAVTAKQDLADAQAQKDQDAYDAAAENEQKTADDLKKAQADHDSQKAIDDAVKQIDNAQQPGGTMSDAYAPKHMASEHDCSPACCRSKRRGPAEHLRHERYGRRRCSSRSRYRRHLRLPASPSSRRVALGLLKPDAVGI